MDSMFWCIEMSWWILIEVTSSIIIMLMKLYVALWMIFGQGSVSLSINIGQCKVLKLKNLGWKGGGKLWW